MEKKNIFSVVTIDGPAGAGKSTIAKKLAKVLHFSYLDTGAMYRALTLKAMRCHLDMEDEQSLVDLAKETHLDLESLDQGVLVLLDGKDVSQDIRSVDVTNNTLLPGREGFEKFLLSGKGPLDLRKVLSSKDVMWEQSCFLRQRVNIIWMRMSKSGQDVDMMN